MNTKPSRNNWIDWLEVPHVWTVLLLFAVTLAAYIPAMRGGYIWDDDAFVTNNELLRAGWPGLRQIWFKFGATDQYYPMAYGSFWLEYQAWGYWATGSHVVNVVLHALNAFLLWKVLNALRVPGAWLAAFIFALHPVEVESVAWITERKNVLSGTFYMLAALAWLRFEPLPGSDPERGRDWRFYALAILLFCFALWSKTVTCSLPAALALVLWWKMDRIRWRDVWPLIPLFIIGAGMGLTTGWMEKHVIGAKGSDWALTLLERFLIAGRAPWFYLSKLLWPEPLIFFYPRWQLDAAVWWQWLFPAATLGALVGLWLARGKIGKAPLMVALFFVGTLFPALGFIDVYPFRYSFVADHFQYLASTGVLALVAAGIVSGLRFLPGGKSRAALCAGLLVMLGALTWRQGGGYHDLVTFYRTILARNPQCWMAHDNLAFGMMRDGRVDDSIAESRQSLAIKPDDPEAHVNLGNAVLAKGQLDEAQELYEGALRVRPDFAEAHSNLGNILLFKKQLDMAINHYQKALELKPDYAEAHNNLGYAWLLQRQPDRAIPEFNKALQLRPDYDQARVNLGNAQRLQGGR